MGDAPGCSGAARRSNDFTLVQHSSPIMPRFSIGRAMTEALAGGVRSLQPLAGAFASNGSNHARLRPESGLSRASAQPRDSSVICPGPASSNEPAPPAGLLPSTDRSSQ